MLWSRIFLCNKTVFVVEAVEGLPPIIIMMLYQVASKTKELFRKFSLITNRLDLVDKRYGCLLNLHSHD